MKIIVNPSSESAAAPRASTAHLLPCEIKYTGPALVSAYFKPSTGKRSLEAAFRGRALKGKSLTVSSGYKGAMLQDTLKADVADGEERRWLHKGTIESITFWKHDEVPHEDEPILKVMRWTTIADVLHADHGEEEQEAEAEEAA